MAWWLVASMPASRIRSKRCGMPLSAPFRSRKSRSSVLTPKRYAPISAFPWASAQCSRRNCLWAPPDTGWTSLCSPLENAWCGCVARLARGQMALPRSFRPRFSCRRFPAALFSAYARIITRQGTAIGEVGDRAKGDNSSNFVADTKSEKFGFDIHIVTSHTRIAAQHENTKWLGFFAAGGIMMAAAGIVVLMPRRTPPNPMTEIEHALEAGEFIPYYQPVVDIRTGQLRGAEVLVRWRKPDGTLVLPGSFIPLMESSGFIRDLTRSLMQKVCEEAGESIGRRPDLKISFNFAGKLFSEPTTVKDVRTIFASSPIKFSQVVLEVTERDPIENFTETRQIIAALQGLGVRIAIDDVGTGHSGLSYMFKLGVDIIKIDKMFVDAIGTDRNSTTIVETLVDLARNMRMDVVAEGVENFEQVMHLRTLGVRSAQGYVFAPPLPGSSFLQLVEALDPLPPASLEFSGAERLAASA